MNGHAMNPELRAQFGDPAVLGWGLQGADEALWREMNRLDADGVRKAAALYYQRAMVAAALLDREAGRVVPEWTVPECPAEYPPSGSLE